MTKERKTYLNKEIAKLLGFRAYQNNWVYSDEFKDQVTSSPQRFIPDFIGIIMNAIKSIELLSGSSKGLLKTDFNSFPLESDINNGN